MKLELKNIHKSYGNHHVLKGINLTVTGGRAMGLLGRNGSGKTTMIRGIMEVFNFDEGTVTHNVEANEIGYLPEERGVYPKSTLKEQMVYFAMLKGVPSKVAKERADYWLDRMELTPYANKKADSLSKGNQQKIQVAIALMHEPEVLILDEPFSGLDPVNSELLKTIVREQINQGKVVLFSSHQMASVEEFCDDIAILNAGEIVLSGDLRDIKANYPKERISFFADNLENLQTQLKMIPEIAIDHVNNESVTVKVVGLSDIFALAKDISNKLVDINGYRIVEPTLEEIFIEYGKDFN
ncbi:MAG: ATP-binding cassette domain-containing protein [Erysipelothrix sp.]|nr:ATP-binding cassette domain-containing protein [Erysipelothrix sp.]